MLAGWLGMEMKTVSDAVGRASKKSRTDFVPAESNANSEIVIEMPDPRKVEHRVEREALKAVLQEPALAMEWYASVEELAYTFLPYRYIHQVVVVAASKNSFDSIEPAVWVEEILGQIENPQLKTLASSLVVEPIKTANVENLEKFVTGVIARLQEFDASRRIADIKGQLLREEEGNEAHQNLFSQLLALEAMRRTLAEHARGHDT
jgi:DNA primase